MKKVFITTPIFYVNDIPHIGHAYTSIVCDVLARFYSLKDYEVKFITGTDEHGLKVEKAANEKKINPQSFVDKISSNFMELTRTLKITNTDFIRTTQNRHKNAVINFWKKLLENNQIYLDNYEGWYSVKDETFYQEKELIKKDGEFFTQDGGEVEWIKEESYFFKLSAWEKKLLDYYEKNPEFILPKSRSNEVISFVKQGLKDLSISRNSFTWGIQVPNNPEHIIYVWIDALTNYLSVLGYPNFDESSDKYWENSIHVIGKDILKFHAIYWPSMLMAAGLNPPKKIFAHGWWTNEGKKISKSLGNTIDPNSLIQKYGLDQLKYFLLREVPLGQDGDFSENAFINRVNADLSNSLGNLVQRTIKFSNKHFKSEFPSELNEDSLECEVLKKGYSLIINFEKKMIAFEFHKAIEEIWKFIYKLNQFIDKVEPWATIKKDRNLTALNISILIEALRLIGILIAPIIPESSNNILNILNIDKDKRSFKFYSKKYLIKKGKKINEPKQIFPRISK